MSFTLVLNSANAYGSQNNTFKYDFIQGNFNIPPDSEVMVANAQIPYSFYNITSAYNNNAFTLSFPTASATYTTFNITIPDGFYTTTSLNYYIQQFCISNGLYLINSTGQNVYYISIQYNSYQYGNQILAFAVPTSLPAGHTAPSNWIGYPTVSLTPYITIASSGVGSQIGTFLGFSGGDYPASGTTANYSKNSDITPVGSTVNSIILRCSLVNNKVGSPMDILDSFAIANTNFGANINYAPSVNKWVKLSSGSFSNFMLTICDQNLQMINSLDNNILITLLFRFGTTKLLKE